MITQWAKDVLSRPGVRRGGEHGAARVTLALTGEGQVPSLLDVMRYKIEVLGFEGQLIEIDSGFFKKTLLVNGSPAPSAGLGSHRLTRNDGREVTTKWAGGLDPAPSVVIDGQTYRTAPPLKPLELVFVFLPLLLMVLGGALGGGLGGAAAMFNAKLMRSSRPPAIRYGGSILITLAAAGVYVVVAGLIHVAVNGAQ